MPRIDPRHGVALLFLLAATAGCGPDYPETAPVTGRVTWQGEPVVSGDVMFYPEEGRIARGAIQSDGSYTLTTFQSEDGALLGTHQVAIDASRVENPGPQAKSMMDEYNVRLPDEEPRITWLVPEQYSRPQSSGLTAEVTEGENVINFELP
jgi:hypothetical protein